jgi:hypothetical protein
MALKFLKTKIIKWLIRSNNAPNHSFTDEERAVSTTVINLKKEIRELDALLGRKDARIADLESGLAVYREQQDQDKWIGLIAGFMGVQMPQQTVINYPSIQNTSANSKQNESPQSDLRLTDDQLKSLISRYSPTQIKMGLSMGDNAVKDFIKGKAPNIDDETLERGLQIAKELVK